MHKAVMDNGRIDSAHYDAVAYLEKHGAEPPKPESPPKKKQSTPKEKEKTPYGKRGGYAKRRNEIEQAPVPDIGSESEPDIEAEAGHVPERIEPFADMTLRQLLARFGTETAFKDWLAALKSLEDVREKRLKNMSTEGRLIAREIVDQHVMGAIDEAMTRLLNDAAKTIAAQSQASAKAGNPVEHIQGEVREVMESHIKGMKAKALRALRDA